MKNRKLQHTLLVIGSFLAMFLVPTMTHATHIVGGEISYTCLGNNQFEITLNVYRDCDTGIEPFDDPAYIAVYDGATNLIASLEVAFTSDDTLDTGVFNECLRAPSNVCVHTTTYKTTVTLADNPAGGYYHIVYQRCCRNATVQNIIEPLHTGAVYDIRITQSAMDKCNSSPMIKNWPPVFICLGEPIIFDHSGMDDTDAVEDSLVYTLCTPFNGGSFNDPKPIPPTNPPPFDTVFWNGPTYSKDNMLGIGDPTIGRVLEIDPKTGILTGLPTIPGQFVVGVCIYEYDKETGELLSMTRRDFQYNIGLCEENPVLALVDTVCSDDLNTYTAIVRTDGFNVTNSVGTLNRVENNIYEISNIPKDQELIISATSIAGSCMMEERITPPDCTCEAQVDVLAPVAPSDLIICAGEIIPELVVTVAEGDIADWFDAPVGGNLLAMGTNTFVPDVPGTYYAEARNIVSGCVSAERTPVGLTINELPQLTIESSGPNCSEDLRSYSVAFNTEADEVSINVGDLVSTGTNAYLVENIPVGTNLEITVKDNTNNCEGTETINSPVCDCTMDMVDAPAISGSDISYCADEPVPALVVTVEPGVTVDWYDGPGDNATLIAESTLTYQPTGPGTFYAESRIIASGCTSDNRTIINLMINELPEVSVDLGSVQCSEDLNSYSFSFTTNGSLIQVNSGTVSNTGPNAYLVSGIESGIDLALQITDTDTGCDRTELISAPSCTCDEVQVDAPISGGDQTICEGEVIPALTVTVPDGVMVDWFDSAIDGNLIQTGTTSFTPAEAGTYFAQARVTVNDCESTTRTGVSLIINETPSFDLTGDSVNCNMTLTHYSVTFSTNANLVEVSEGNMAVATGGTRRIEMIPVENSVTITLTNQATSCVRTITIDPPKCDCELVEVPLALKGEDQSICVGDPIPSLTATVEGGFTVDWYDDPFSGNLLASGTSTYTSSVAGTFYAEARSLENGCTSASRVGVTLSINELPMITITSEGVSCSEDKLSYGVSIITNANLVTVNSGTVTIGDAGMYSISNVDLNTDLTITLENRNTGCKKDTTIIAPNCPCEDGDVMVPISGGDVEICTGETIPALTVTVDAGNVVNWYDAPTGGNILIANSTTFTPTQAGVFYAEAENTKGCTSERTPVSLVINDLPRLLSSANECAEDLTTYSATFSTDGDGASVNAGMLTDLGGGNFRVMEIPVETNLEITISNSITTCTNQVTLEAPICTCDSVTVDPPISGGDHEICPGDPIPALTVTVPDGITVNWYAAADGGTILATGTSFTPSGGGTFYAESEAVINGCKSITRTALTISLIPLPEINIAPDNPICSADFLSYNVTFNTSATVVEVSDGTLESDGSNGYTVSGVPAGATLAIQLFDEVTGCNNSVTVGPPNCTNPCDTITVQPPVNGGDVSYCENDPIPVLTASTEDGTVVDWYDAPAGGTLLLEGSATFQPNQPGTYYAEARTIPENCVSDSRTEITLSAIALPTFMFQADQTQCTQTGDFYTVFFATDAPSVVASVGTLEELQPGQFQVSNVPTGTDIIIELENMGTGCNRTETIISPDCPCFGITVNPPGADITTYETCESDDPPQFTVTIENGGTADWYTEPEGGTPILEGSLTFTPSEPGTYYAEARTVPGDCPSDTRTAITWTVLPSPTFELEAGNPICAINLQTYSIVFQTDADEIEVNLGIIENISGGRYSVSEVPVDSTLEIILTNTMTGCTSIETIPPQDCPPPPCVEPYVFLPNTFTPNADGRNDVLRVRSEVVESMRLIIYNRWGEELFQSQDQSQVWDGTYKGEELPPDVYGYYLNVVCIGGETFVKKGDITLIR